MKLLYHTLKLKIMEKEQNLTASNSVSAFCEKYKDEIKKLVNQPLSGNSVSAVDEKAKVEEIGFDYIKHRDSRYIKEDYIIRTLYPEFIKKMLQEGRIKILEGNKDYFSTILGEPTKIFYEFIPENISTKEEVKEDPRDNSLIGEDDSWVNDIDMGSR
jgi:hypothetical protein